MATAIARMALGSIFAAVDAAANAAASIFDTTVRSVRMLDRYVRDDQARQEVRSVVDVSDFTVSLVENAELMEAI